MKYYQYLLYDNTRDNDTTDGVCFYISNYFIDEKLCEKAAKNEQNSYNTDDENFCRYEIMEGRIIGDFEVDGMSLARFIASQLLKDSSYTGLKYFDKENNLAEKIQKALDIAKLKDGN